VSENRFGSEGSSSPELNRYRLLLEITNTVAGAESLADAFEKLAPPVLDLTEGELLSLSLHDSSRNRMVTQYWKRNQESGAFAAPPDEAATGWVWKHQELLAIPDTQQERRFPGCLGVLPGEGVRSYTVLPMSTPSSRFGALGLGKSIPAVLNSEDVEFLSTVAELTALALEKTRSHRAFEEQQITSRSMLFPQRRSRP